MTHTATAVRPSSVRVETLVPMVLFAGYVALFVWGAISPYDRATWWAENIPIVGVVTTLVVMYLRGVRFSPLAYVLMAVLPYWHTVGGHYTFERVPFDWFNRAFALSATCSTASDTFPSASSPSASSSICSAAAR